MSEFASPPPSPVFDTTIDRLSTAPPSALPLLLAGTLRNEQEEAQYCGKSDSVLLSSTVTNRSTFRSPLASTSSSSSSSCLSPSSLSSLSSPSSSSLLRRQSPASLPAATTTSTQAIVYCLCNPQVFSDSPGYARVLSDSTEARGVFIDWFMTAMQLNVCMKSASRWIKLLIAFCVHFGVETNSLATVLVSVSSLVAKGEGSPFWDAVRRAVTDAFRPVSIENAIWWLATDYRANFVPGNVNFPKPSADGPGGPQGQFLLAVPATPELRNTKYAYWILSNDETIAELIPCESPAQRRRALFPLTPTGSRRKSPSFVPTCEDILASISLSTSEDVGFGHKDDKAMFH